MIDLSKDFSIYYNGLPIKPKYKGRKFNWITILQMLKSLEEDDNGNKYLYIDGWKFDISYGLMYLRDCKSWNYYLPVDGVKDKFILDVGGGCGETAKFFLKHGAFSVDIIEFNEKCREYLEYNSKHHNIRAWIKKFDIKDIFYEHYDLIKMDIEGYEMELLPYLNKINVDIILETHSPYITDKFIEKGFNHCNEIKKGDTEIYGGNAQLCRWKK